MINKIKTILGGKIEKCEIKNLFKSNFRKKVLISYTIFPFILRDNLHTNIQESRIITKIFNDLGYCVDIIHYSNKTKINYSNYDIIFGFGEPFENSFRSEKNILRINYATGAHICYQNYAEIKRIKEVNKKKCAYLVPKRLVPANWSMSTTMSDAMIIIGNEWTKSTYEKFGSNIPIHTLNATALYNQKTQYIIRDIEIAKANFLWFGSNGLILKGLDLCLDFFSERDDLCLHICGGFEKEFFEVFSRQFNQKNIFYYDYIDVQSDTFIEIISKCLFTIMPTCSEGQSTALLTTMGGGLIPISTVYSGLDINALGFCIDSLTYEGIESAVSIALSQSNEKLLYMSTESLKYINLNHSIPYFEKSFKKIIMDVITQNSQ